MFSYQHIYHAGNFADVHKHAIVSLLIEQLKKKPAPFFILDAHGGRGLYPLDSPEAQKTSEHLSGISRIWPSRTGAPPILAPYLKVIADANPGGALTCYPGSPLVTLGLMRSIDKMAVMEKHPGEIRFLRNSLGHSRQVAVHDRDAYEGMLALIPPPEKRGLALIDPSYEDKNEYALIPQKLALALKKWPQGIFAVWYPLLPAGHHEKLINGLMTQKDVEIIDSRIEIKDSPMALSGSGMIVINPPWKIDEEIAVAGKWIAQVLGGTCSLNKN